MKSIKKIMALLLSVLLIAGIMAIMPISVSAAEDEKFTGLKAQKVAMGFDGFSAIDEYSALWTSSSSGTDAGDSGVYHMPNKASRILPNGIVSVKSAINGYEDAYSYGTRIGQSAALDSDANLWIWGLNRYGTVGNGECGNRKRAYNPYKVESLSHVVDYDVSAINSAAVTEDGSLYIWGSNTCGQVIGSTEETVCTPTKIMGDVKSVSVGAGKYGISAMIAVIKNDNSLWMWGNNDSPGSLGVQAEINGNIVYEPVHVLDNVKSVDIGIGYTLAIKNDNTLWSWGENSSGQLGTGGTTSTFEPTEIMSNVKSVAPGLSHVLALKNNGTLYSWGSNSYGELGNDSTSSNYMPTKIMEDVTEIGAGFYNSIAIKEDGSLWRWGITELGYDVNWGYSKCPYEKSRINVDLLNRTVDFRAEGQQRDIDISWSDKWLEDNSSTYNHELAIAGVVLSTAAENNNASDTLNRLGFHSGYNYNYDANVIDKPACSVGYKILYDTNGKKTIDIALVCCGTRYAENPLTNGDLITDIKAQRDGFLTAGKESYNCLNKALTRISNDTGFNITSANSRIFITGHSLGGACANVVTKLIADKEQFDLDKIYMYTYASPKVCVDVTNFKTRYSVPGAFNIVNNTGDIVHHFWNFSYTEKTGLFGIKYISKGINARMGRTIAYNNMDSNYKFRAHAATLYGQQYDDLFSMKRAHYSTTYLAALLSDEPLEYVAKTFRLLTVSCPVDVEIYDKDGNCCGYTKNGEVFNDNISPVRIVVIGDEKFVEIPEGSEYTVKYIGYDSGTMKVDDQVYNIETGDVESEKLFEDVSLEKGKLFSSSIDGSDSTENTDLYVVDEDGDKLQSVDGKGVETSLSQYDITEYDIDINVKDYKYDGTAKTQNVKVDERLTEGQDYKIVYKNNTKVGVGTVTVKGINDFYGRVSKTFNIYDNGTIGDSISWDINPAGVLTISGEGSIPDYDSDNKAPWSENSASIKKILIENGITTIGNNSFIGCENLSDLYIPTSVTQIGDNATDGCSELSEIHYEGTDEQWNEITIGTNNAKITENEKTYNSEMHIHDLKKVESKEATYTDAGNTEYWVCNSCGKFFSDSEGINEIEKDSWIIPKLIEPTEPSTSESNFTEPDSSESQPTVPSSSESNPTDPSTSGSNPTEPSSSENNPSEPSSSENQPTEPSPSSINPTAPTSSESTEPTEPNTNKPSEPASSEPITEPEATKAYKFLPNNELENKGCSYKLLVQDNKGNLLTFDFSATSTYLDGVKLYTANVPESIVPTMLIYQFFDGDTWVGQVTKTYNELTTVYGSIVKADGTIYGEETSTDKPSEPTEPTTDKTVEPTEKPSDSSGSSSTEAKSSRKNNPIKVSVKTKSVKAKSLKSKKQTVKPLTITKNKGAVVVTLVKSGTTKKIRSKVTVSKKGIITLKKGKYTKGSYKIKVKIVAKGNSKFKSKTLNKTLKIIIK